MRDVLSALAQLKLLQSQLDNIERRRVELISQLRDRDNLLEWEPISWTVIARAMGVSRQAAWARYSWIDDPADDE